MSNGNRDITTATPFIEAIAALRGAVDDISDNTDDLLDALNDAEEMIWAGNTSLAARTLRAAIRQARPRLSTCSIVAVKATGIFWLCPEITNTSRN